MLSHLLGERRVIFSNNKLTDSGTIKYLIKSEEETRSAVRTAHRRGLRRFLQKAIFSKLEIRQIHTENREARIRSKIELQENLITDQMNAFMSIVVAEQSLWDGLRAAFIPIHKNVTEILDVGTQRKKRTNKKLRNLNILLEKEKIRLGIHPDALAFEGEAIRIAWREEEEAERIRNDCTGEYNYISGRRHWNQFFESEVSPDRRDQRRQR